VLRRAGLVGVELGLGCCAGEILANYIASAERIRL
jgi:hypothetical protein